MSYQSKSGYNYSFVFYPEKKGFSEAYQTRIYSELYNNWTFSFLYAFLYVVIIYVGRQVMKSRERFDLRRQLIAWNIALAAFSALGTIRVWPEFLYILRNHGVVYSVCERCDDGVFALWALWFIHSKVAELFDTAFIVLRKQPLIFLHWYHHATVLIYCWYSGHDRSASGRWFIVMNFTVHSAMYAYYAFRAMRYQIPKAISVVITFGQIMQMVFGIYINLVAYFHKQKGFECHTSYENIAVSFLMYASYFLLFCKFFYSAYLKKQTKKQIIKMDEKQADTLMYSISSATKIHVE